MPQLLRLVPQAESPWATVKDPPCHSWPNKAKENKKTHWTIHLRSAYFTKCKCNYKCVFCFLNNFFKKEKSLFLEEKLLFLEEKSLLPGLELLGGPQNPRDGYQAVPVWAGPLPLYFSRKQCLPTRNLAGLWAPYHLWCMWFSESKDEWRAPGKQWWQKVKPGQISSPDPVVKPEPF